MRGGKGRGKEASRGRQTLIWNSTRSLKRTISLAMPIHVVTMVNVMKKLELAVMVLPSLRGILRTAHRHHCERHTACSWHTCSGTPGWHTLGPLHARGHPQRRAALLWVSTGMQRAQCFKATYEWNNLGEDASTDRCTARPSGGRMNGVRV